ncbi:MAG: SLBB domain-containing protein [Candidatus Kapabacteria bacterium]|nr:SLBB domain-containing protein [Candidatus Kapabacteria bacterium]
MQLLRFVVLVVIIGFGLAGGFGELYGQGSGSALDFDKLSGAGTRATQPLSALLTSEQMPTDNVVDATVYRLGPGDILAWGTTGLDVSEKLAIVGPENAIVFERFGLIGVSGMTIQRLRDSLSALVKARTPSIDVWLTLRRPRLIFVRVSGAVPFPGMYKVPASMRVSTLLEVMSQPGVLRTEQGDASQQERLSLERSRFAEITRSNGSWLTGDMSRNIVVRHQRGGTTPVDLPMSILPGRSSLDPHLREGDEVVVPYSAPSGERVSIEGAVLRPTSLPWKRGDRASILLAAAAGLQSDADVQRAVLINPRTGSRVTLALDSTMVLTGDDPLLEPGAVIVVDRLVTPGGVSPRGVVIVEGNVVRPGPISLGGTEMRLTDAIAQAGGITESAALSLAYVVRSDEQFGIRERTVDLYRTFQYSDLQLEDTLRYRLDQEFRLPYVSCNVAEAFANPSSPSNIVLRGGDKVVIPQRPDRVYVYGQVANPGYVGFEQKKNLRWYIERAGGFATGARPGRARIIKGRTKVWVEADDEVHVEPGDEVYVPRAPDVPAGTEIQYYAVIAGVLSSLAAMVSVLVSILRR